MRSAAPVGEPGQPALAEPVRRVGAAWIGLLALANLGLWAALYGPIQILLPKQAELLDAAGKEAALGLVLGCGAVVSLVTNPVVGALSDRTVSRRGRRLPWIACGAGGGAAGLVVLLLAPSVAVLVLGWCLVQAGCNTMLAALVAVVPDQVPTGQRGLVGGWVNVAMTLGVLTGTVLATALGGVLLGYLACAVFLLVAVVPWLVYRRDVRLPAGVRPDSTVRSVLVGLWVSPRRHPDFGWAWITRFLMNLGNALGLLYLYFYLQDQVGHPDPDSAVLTCTVSYAAALVATAVVGGVWSDRVRRRRVFVAGAAVVMGVAAALLAVWPVWTGVLVASAVLGAGFGVYQSVDFALLTEVLPNARDRAKDLGMINIANSLPQVLAPVIAAPIVASFGGYPVLYLLAALVGVLGGVLVYRIRGVR